MTRPDAEQGYAVGVVILAAGRSVRMGQAKLLLPWDNTSVLGHLLAQWRALGAVQIAVVCAADDRALHQELERLGFPAGNRVDNPAPERGMFSSVQCAARWPGWKAGLTHWAIVLGDQPHLRPETLRGLLAFGAARAEQVCQPTRGGRRGHPVLLPKRVFAELAATAATDLKAFLTACRIAGCEVDDPGLELDIDRPEDYRRALAMSGAGLKAETRNPKPERNPKSEDRSRKGNKDERF